MKFPHCGLKAVLALKGKVTVWKSNNFPIAQILCEINFESSKNAKSAVLTHFEALNFNFCEILHLWKA